MNEAKKRMLDRIRSNIDSSGRHISVVAAGPDPRYAYTIGNYTTLKFELILSGASYYSNVRDVAHIINHISEALISSKTNNDRFQIDGLGAFNIKKIDSSWSKLLMLGVFDYYEIEGVEAYQIIPEADHFTLDTPDMSIPFDRRADKVWEWLDAPWTLTFPKDTFVLTDINALMGKPLNEFMRWDENIWEMFAGEGENIPDRDLRKVPLATMLGIDPSIYELLNVDVGKGFWRKAKGDIWSTYKE